MISRLILLSIFTVSTAFMMSAENADSCVQSQRTQEQFQQEFNEFIKNTRAYMLAKENIPADSIHLLTKEQKQTIKYANNLSKNIKNTIELPIEINHLLDDNLGKKIYNATLLMKDAHFVARENCQAALFIPMIAQIESHIVESELSIILANNGDFHRIVYSTFALPSESIQEYICLKSNISGTLLSTVVFNDSKIIAEIDAKGYPWGVIDSPKDNNFDLDRRNRDEKYRYTKVRSPNYYKNTALKSNGKLFKDTKGRYHFY